MIGIVRRVRWLVAFVLLLSCATACTSSNERNSKDCLDKSCTGTIDGANYAIRVPKKWNGTLLLYSHGYRPTTSPNLPTLSNSDGTGKGEDAVSQLLLSKGYALAGSSYAKQGWATADALKAADDLYHRFVSLKGKPKRTYAWGISLGGLVTELLDERADWVDGAVAFCGAVAGPLLNFDNWSSATFAVKTLVAPQLRLTGFPNLVAANAEGQLAARQLTIAAADRTNGAAAAALYAADSAGLPDKTAQFPGNNPATEGDGAIQVLQQYVRLWYLLEPDLEQRFGGVPAQVSTSAPQLTDAESSLVATLHGDVASLGAKLASAGGVPADQQARTAAEASGTPTGKLRAPLLTLHGVYDSIVIAANETVLHDRVVQAGKADLLQQSYMMPTGTTGYGHCGFTPQQVVGTLTTLDTWVRTGHKPTQQDEASAAGQGIDPNYQPPAWPR